MLGSARVQQVVKGNTARHAAVLGALLIVLRFYHMSKKRRAPKYYVTDFSEVARKVGEEAQAQDVEEFDVIVVGGGASRTRISSV